MGGDRLAGRKVVKDDHVAWPERWREDLLDIGKESAAPVIAPSRVMGTTTPLSVRPPIKLKVFPAPWRNRGAAAHASGRTAIHPGHLGLRPAVVDKDEALRLQIGLAVESRAKLVYHIRAVLLSGVRGLFFVPRADV